MKKLVILSISLLFFYCAKAQTVSDSLKYLYAQVSILKTLIGTNKAEFLTYKYATDKRIKILEDSMAKIRPLIFHVDDFIFNKGELIDTVKLKTQVQLIRLRQ